MTLILNHADVIAAVDMQDAIDAMEAAFAEEGSGGVKQPPRTNIPLANGFLRIGPVVMEQSGWMGFKAMNLSAGIGVRYQVHLYTVADGDLKAIMDAQHLTTLRTGATSAVATRRLAREEAVTVAVLGSGVEARAQLEAVHALGLVAKARVFSPTRENREAFAADYSESLGIDVTPVPDARAAVDGAGMVVAAVKSSEHAFYGAWLEPGMHVNSVGTARPNQREIDPETFARSDITVVDTRHGVLNEAGDAIEAADAIVPDEVHELCSVVAADAPRRTDDAQITPVQVGRNRHPGHRAGCEGVSARARTGTRDGISRPVEHQESLRARHEPNQTADPGRISGAIQPGGVPVFPGAPQGGDGIGAARWQHLRTHHSRRLRHRRQRGELQDPRPAAVEGRRAGGGVASGSYGHPRGDGDVRRGHRRAALDRRRRDVNLPVGDKTGLEKKCPETDTKRAFAARSSKFSKVGRGSFRRSSPV